MRHLTDYDVVVVGGGPGGCGAAVTAARSGARTLLVEREGFLGGGATAMYVHPFMTERTKPGPHGEASKVCNAGLFKEIIDRLIARGRARPCEGCGPEFDDEALKVVLDEVVTEAGADVLFHAALFHARTEDGRVDRVGLAHNGEPIEAVAKVFIDSTGDGLLAAQAGCPFQVGDEEGRVMPMTLNFSVAGVDPKRVPRREEMKKRCAAGADDDPPLINTNFSTAHFNPNGWYHVNAIRVGGDTLDPFDVSRAEIESRRRVQNFVAWLRARVPGFENAYLAKTGPHIGIRESRRIVGEYTLTREDWARCARFDDAVACTSYNIDVHKQQQGVTQLESLPPGGSYQIPYRSLLPKGVSNLLVASRSISADVEAHSSLRVMPPVMSLGEAAGYAAALALPEGDVRAVDVKAVQAKIVEGGGLVEPRSLDEWPDHYAADVGSGTPPGGAVG